MIVCDNLFLKGTILSKEMLPIYKTLTEQVKKQMSKLDVVLPRRYYVLFTDIAKENNISLGPEETVTNETLDDKVVQHVEQLNNSANKAVDAIETKNVDKLQEVLQETKALREEIEQLRSAVYKDSLTKVFNRRWMEENYLHETTETFMKDGILALVDMNDFKYINDHFGHVSGDKVLFYVASQLRRTGGQVVRFGGDEFFVLFDDGTTTDKANQKMHNVRELVIKKLLKAEGKTFKTSFSYGLAEFTRGDIVNSVVQVADEAMYDDKILIKNRLAK